jgi:hypothetical protein
MPGFAEVPPGGPPEGLPPSFAQQRFWFLDRLAPGDPSSNLVFAHRLSGALDVSALRDAFTEVVSKHKRCEPGLSQPPTARVRSSIPRPQWQSRWWMCRPWPIQSRRLAVWRRPAITA